MIYAALFAYAATMVAANLLVAVFGPVITPLNAFVLIGFDLAMRDWLHVRLRVWQMLLLILATGAVTFGLNPSAGVIAVASAASFTAAAIISGVWALPSVPVWRGSIEAIGPSREVSTGTSTASGR